MKSIRVPAIALASFALCAAALANESPMHRSDQSNMSPEMRKFQTVMMLNQIHHINQKEIALSRIALDKSQSQEVKNFAQKMVTEHGQADQKVSDLAKSQDVSLEKFQPATYEKVESDRLAKLDGQQFDQAYMASMRMGHRHALRDLEAARNETQDPQLKSLISELTPSVRAHERSASTLVPSSKMQQAGTASQSDNK